MKILIIGASGPIGNYLYKGLSKYKKYELLGITSKKNKKQLTYYDFKNLKKLDKIIKNFEIIIFCTALSKFNECEKYKSKSKYLNVTLLSKIISSLKPQQKLIYLSTLGVKSNFFNKTPIYIKHKKIAERKIKKKLVNYFIVRPAKVFETINIKHNNGVVTAYEDLKISFTSLKIILLCINKIIIKNLIGSINLCSKDKISYLSLYKKYFKYKKIDIKSSKLNNAFHFKEPLKHKFNKEFYNLRKSIKQIIQP